MRYSAILLLNSTYRYVHQRRHPHTSKQFLPIPCTQLQPIFHLIITLILLHILLLFIHIYYMSNVVFLCIYFHRGVSFWKDLNAGGGLGVGLLMWVSIHVLSGFISSVWWLSEWHISHL